MIYTTNVALWGFSLKIFVISIFFFAALFYWIEYLSSARQRKKTQLNNVRHLLIPTGLSQGDSVGYLNKMFRGEASGEEFDFISHCAYGILNNVHDTRTWKEAMIRECDLVEEMNIYDNIVFMKHGIVFISSADFHGKAIIDNDEIFAEKHGVRFPLPDNISRFKNFLRWDTYFSISSKLAAKGSDRLPLYHIVCLGEHVQVNDSYESAIQLDERNFVFIVRNRKHVLQLLQYIAGNHQANADRAKVREFMEFCEREINSAEKYGSYEKEIADKKYLGFSIMYQNKMQSNEMLNSELEFLK